LHAGAGVDVLEKRKIFFYCFELNNNFPFYCRRAKVHVALKV